MEREVARRIAGADHLAAVILRGGMAVVTAERAERSINPPCFVHENAWTSKGLPTYISPTT